MANNYREFGSPKHIALVTEADQSHKVFNNMVDCYVKAAHSIAEQRSADPYGFETQCIAVYLMLQRTPKGRLMRDMVPYDDVVALLAIATCRLAEMEHKHAADKS